MVWLQEEEERGEADQNEKREQVAQSSDEKDQALREMMLATAREAQQLAKSKTSDQREELCKLSGALAVLASASVSLPSDSAITSVCLLPVYYLLYFVENFSTTYLCKATSPL